MFRAPSLTPLAAAGPPEVAGPLGSCGADAAAGPGPGPGPGAGGGGGAAAPGGMRWGTAAGRSASGASAGKRGGCSAAEGKPRGEPPVCLRPRRLEAASRRRAGGGRGGRSRRASRERAGGRGSRLGRRGREDSPGGVPQGAGPPTSGQWNRLHSHPDTPRVELAGDAKGSSSRLILFGADGAGDRQSGSEKFTPGGFPVEVSSMLELSEGPDTE